ncbi:MULTISPECIES: transcriptional regulator NrdR [Brevibacillus]|uniref:Transcriptional repressor NrdR n=1 Tax=Brevibacillus laterosporus TaxID=1465 RepID=A0AAP3DFW7_BRELA|nr:MULTISPECIES: transcriptional regulator NrdR [Brevibacillus]ATO50281.1 transcriptional regulator NrdR [Brevibacillus laterosporus DSM 25]AYB39536.1 transcriptional regulator NrdR [Brevibacillus laterosporus]MBG9771875.1 transcriptional regulator NrdR [Brevibacillus laterosporus]MBG9786524.1 transcriptional regulator NrdR [Brevibacillus laterosporus]MBG9797247.1 transcriptional regulator NrdR [Brevibacillus laterosporus]
MRCPFCEFNGTRVLDSRPFNNNKSIRRRRECEDCGRRFTTFEMVEETPLLIIKKDGTREEYSRDKILRGLIRACEKRPVTLEILENIVNEIERELRSQGKAEVPSKEVGEMVMERLYHVDEVAYVRFASVYRQFKDINVFMRELEELLEQARNQPPKMNKPE